MEVLFKPTKASEVPIRHDYDQAVSYFVGAAAAGEKAPAHAERTATLRTRAPLRALNTHGVAAVALPSSR